MLGVPYTCDLFVKLWDFSSVDTCDLTVGAVSVVLAVPVVQKNFGEYVLCVFACYSSGSR